MVCAWGAVQCMCTCMCVCMCTCMCMCVCMCRVHLDQQCCGASQRIDQDEEGGEEQRRGQHHLARVCHIGIPLPQAGFPESGEVPYRHTIRHTIWAHHIGNTIWAYHLGTPFRHTI